MSSAHDVSLLAHAAGLTRRGSLHTYLVIRCMVDRDLVRDGFRAYAYFRWLDDVLDLQLGERQQRAAMVKEQAELARRAFAGDFPRPACAEEQLLQDLIRGHRSGHPGLTSYVNCMMQVMAFDAGRRGRLVGAAELEEYTRLLAGTSGRESRESESVFGWPDPKWDAERPAEERMRASDSRRRAVPPVARRSPSPGQSRVPRAVSWASSAAAWVFSSTNSSAS
jgi:hypothetical protein